MTLPDTTKASLSAWLEVRGTEPGPLFLNLDRASSSHANRRLSPTSVNRILGELGERLGFELRPHGLRHAAITQALELTNGNYRAVARFSRHRDIRVLNVYDDNREDLGGSVARLVASSIQGGL
jgi:integrase/recombinase XerC